MSPALSRCCCVLCSNSGLDLSLWVGEPVLEEGKEGCAYEAMQQSRWPALVLGQLKSGQQTSGVSRKGTKDPDTNLFYQRKRFIFSDINQK